MFDFAQFDAAQFLVLVVTFLVAITVHEFMHAWTAFQLGDDTAYHLGRISLNPAVHFDPLGFFMFLLLALGFPALAWGKPVPVNTYRLRPLGRFGRTGSMALVAFAGPLSNVVLASVAAFSFRLNGGFPIDTPVKQALIVFLSINVFLAAFNLIPVPPLDGSRILAALLPPFWQPYLASLERYGFAILLVLILFGNVLGGDSVIAAIAGPPRDLLLGLLTGR
ncbi:MAG: site-2 protease family protein [Chloroflexia bacterium]|nr:site-2 protease family protein [Chloroflexia bacterium]